ncbi:MAG: DNA polymerase III subunit delta [Clostridia bacterium]|nr:DNA polymerase III subunit delta [Clostridia bacterium]
MDLNELKARLKSGNVGGWYIFAGEEEYLKKHYISALRDVILDDPVFSPFNHIIFDGADIEIAALTEAVKSAPMMSEYKLVEWRYADLEHMKGSALSAFEDFLLLKDSHPYTVFVMLLTTEGFDPGTPKRPSKLMNKYSKTFDILNFPKSTDAQLLPWLKRHFDKEEISVTVGALNALIFRSGHGMEVLKNEVEKLSAYLKANGRRDLTERDVNEVASSSAECDAFALSNAIIGKSRDGAFVALTDMKLRRIDPMAVLGMLAKVYSELSSVAILLDEGAGAADIESALSLNPYKVKLYVSAAKKYGSARLSESLQALSRADAAAKYGGITGWCAIEMFIAENI